MAEHTEHTEKNRQYFDNLAKSYKDSFKPVLDGICRNVTARRTWISDTWTDTEAGQGKEIKVLDYACGTGVVSLTLAPFVSKIVGMDVADNMINQFNQNAHDAGFGDKMSAIKGDLLSETLSDELSGPEYSDFDIVVVSAALHHFEKPELAMSRFCQRLKKGGVCLIIDIVPDHHRMAHDFGEAEHTVTNHGFTEEQMRQLHEGAGLNEDFRYQSMNEQFVYQKDGKQRTLTFFLSRGQRA
ncbi:putative SAM-dependent methyltransferase [Aspergillus heteromorphus CBS 117.55]|uniref:Putative SAM-dependent methyltransferase n=1 Tax=Aspergillus heteromorphus CBS 117.55 TaxID=1448321 RepID=A0A317WPT4_9EURO|nr:putative SAM-dependent methyltransferase [Aspergillus heteromorphus CBS 117.55]PWY88433.1 putative SAM-dependent methyltransferase [Aspergillus heteromorphus CBS 117.55]